MVPVI